MAPRPVPLATRLARLTDAPEDLIRETFANPTLHMGLGPCWTWKGSLAYYTPIFKHNGKMQSVRRVAYAECHPDGLPADIRVERGCPNFFCVSPQHALPKKLQLGCQPEPTIDDDPIDDVVATVYDQAEPWDAADIATHTGYSLAKVSEAIAGIRAGLY